MTGDPIHKMYQLIKQTPDAQDVINFEKEAAADPELMRAWHDFLVEQSLSQGLDAQWTSYLNRIDGLRDQISFQESIQNDIRLLQDRKVRTEIESVLPYKPVEKLNRQRHLMRPLLARIAAAAVVLLCLGVLWRFLLSDMATGTTTPGSIPYVMVEDFDFKGVSEHMLVHEIAQRLPAKLSVANGIYPLTSYSVQHASSRMNPNRVADELHATHKVIGTVTGTGDELRIHARLVDVRSNRTLWKDNFKSPQDPKSFDDMQDALSLQIADVLNLNVSPDAKSYMSKEVSMNAEAIKLFLTGERAWNERSESSLKESIEIFKRALALDTTSTIIRGYLALAYETNADNEYDTSHWKDAEREAVKTLRLDPNNPEALVVLGYVSSVIDDDYERAASYFNRALEIQPSDAKIHQAIAELHLRTGKIELGNEHILIARAIEPEHRVVRWLQTKYLTGTGRLEDARIAADELMAMYPGYPNIQNFYWQYYLTRGEYDKAMAAIPKHEADEYYRVQYMQAMVYLDQMNYEALHVLFPEGLQASFQLLEHVQKDEWTQAYDLLRTLLETDAFGLLPLSQTSGFKMFDKMKQDPQIQRIYRDFGIQVNLIPESTDLEM